MTKKELIEHSDFFIIQVFRNDECIFYRYYKTYAQAEEAFVRLKSSVKHQMSQGINAWTNNLYKAWKGKDPNFETVRSHIESTWCNRYGMNRKLEELYSGDVWNHFHDCLCLRFMPRTRITEVEGRFCFGDDIQRFEVNSLSFNEDKRNYYAFKLTSANFDKDVDVPRRWMNKEGIKTKK